VKPIHPWKITIAPAKDGTVKVRTQCRMEDEEARCFTEYVEKALLVLSQAEAR
jgi:hypothetical protein